MADKKLSSVNAVSDMNYVYAETSSGETVKISKSDLASVVAGVIGLAGLNNNGLMPEGLFVRSGNKTNYLDAGASYNLGGLEDINGFVIIRDGYSWGGFNLYWCSYAKVFALGRGGTSHSLEYVDGNYLLTNNGSQRRGYQIYYQKIRYE